MDRIQPRATCCLATALNLTLAILNATALLTLAPKWILNCWRVPSAELLRVSKDESPIAVLHDSLDVALYDINTAILRRCTPPTTCALSDE